MALITLSGAPGSGKTTVATELIKHLNITQVINLDQIKDIFRVLKYPPISYSASLEAWKFIGQKNKENIIKGFNLYASCYEEILLGLIDIMEERDNNYIIEGVMLTPHFLSQIKVKNKHSFYFDLPSQQDFFKRYDAKNKNLKKKYMIWYKSFDVTEIINSYLKKECEKYKIPIIHNYSIVDTVKTITNLVTKC